MAQSKQIIAFCGRMQSGKTELAKVCEELGYTKLYFALPLKKLICSLRSISIEELNEQKTANYDYVLHDMDFKFLANETQIPYKIVKEKLENVVFHNSRDLLQIIGTDLIRAYNTNWHVNRVREMIENCENDKIVIDDVRFKNEYDLIKELGGTMWFIARPANLNVSHHSSEETLTWHDFENIIVNKYPLEYLKTNWRMFLENGYTETLAKRSKILQKLKDNGTDMSQREFFSLIDMLLISTDELRYEKLPNDFVGKNGVLSFVNFLLTKSPQYNALQIEDLKKFI